MSTKIRLKFGKKKKKIQFRTCKFQPEMGEIKPYFYTIVVKMYTIMSLLLILSFMLKMNIYIK